MTNPLKKLSIVDATLAFLGVSAFTYSTLVLACKVAIRVFHE